MKRISELERQYITEALNNEFRTSLNSVFGARFEKAFAELFARKYAVAHINGTATLHTALMALDIKKGDEVIVPPLTMSSTALAVLQNGSIPVFADVDRNTFNLNPQSVRAAVTPRTKAIMSVALYGLSPDYDELLSICREKGLRLIEDNAESFMSEYRGKIVGTFGDFASFSFQASKHLTAGEGGMLVTDDVVLANNARRFSSLGYAGVSANKGKISRNDIQDPGYARHVSFGFNYRMSEVTAAILLGQLERWRDLVEQRVLVAALFRDALEGTSVLVPQDEPEGYKNSYWTFAAVLDTKDPQKEWYDFRTLFQANGGDGYYAAWRLSYQEPLFQTNIQQMPGVWQSFKKGLCPVAEYLQSRMIQLKTNYWDLEIAKRQAEILRKTVNQFQR